MWLKTNKKRKTIENGSLIKKVFFMNLLQLLQKEIKFKKVNSKLEIARYLYIRTGEIFEYNPFYAFANFKEAEKISQKRLDMKNITDFFITCTSWAYLYVDLLCAFHIPATVVETKTHAYVKIFLEGKVFLADLTNENEDLMRIKFKLKTLFQRQIAPVAPKVETSFDEMDDRMYRKDRKTETGIQNIKTYLKKLKPKFPKETEKEDYLYVVFKTVEQMLPSYEVENIGVVSGTKFIEYLLSEFEVEYPFSFMRIYDRKTNECSQIYMIKRKGKEHFFSYNIHNGIFALREQTKEEILNMETSSNLILSKKNNKIENKHAIIN